MKERIAFVDYIRVIACLLVMVVHASEQFYNMGPVSQVVNEDNRLWVSVYDGFFGRISVPLFMIVSAFLLVPMKPGMTMSQFYHRRFLRILPPFICFLVLYAILPATWGGFTWNEALEQLKMVPFNFPLWGGHLWFMYPLISLYLIIPVVSPWLEKSSAKDERIFLGIFAFSTLIPWLHRFVSPELWGECFWNQYSALWYCSGYLGYLVLAHYIRVHLKWSWNNLLCRRRVVYRMEFLVEGCAGCADGDTDDGMVMGVLHPQRIAWHLRRLPAVLLHPEGSPMD